MTQEVARLVAAAEAADPAAFENVRVLFSFASHEEIGRFGSTVLAGTLKPDCVLAVDVNHDYGAAPNRCLRARVLFKRRGVPPAVQCRAVQCGVCV